jgi:uncharacterized protein (DUF58 family)
VSGALDSARGALRGLTTRGRSFLAAGITTAAAAITMGQRDLLRVGVLVTALPLVSAWVVSRTRYRLACTRRLDPARVSAGQSSTVVVRLDNVSRLPTGLLLLEDRVPYAVGSRPRFVLDRVEPRGHRTIAYPVRSDVRGRFTIGPISLRLTDPFGLCELHRSFTATDRLAVTPVVSPLESIPLGGEWTGSGESRARSVAAAGEDDVATREYRYGDALHRVHWRSTARYGELMVRREEQPWQARATLLLDARATAHRGEGAASSFEWAVSAAASIGVHLVRRGYAVRLLSESGASVASAAHDSEGVGSDFEGLLLDALAVMTASRATSLSDAVPALRRGGDGLLVAILGGLDLDAATTLARLGHATTAVALVLDVSTWGTGHKRDDDVAVATSRAATLLERSGWRVVRVRAGDTVAGVWPQAARGATQPAGGAA